MNDNRDLLEALADIAYLAGQDSYYGGDSREDISQFIDWAQEFDRRHQYTDWNEADYIETVTAFAEEKLNLVRK